MAATFQIQPTHRFAGSSEPVKRPKEFACFSYDDNHEYHPGEQSLRWYYPPRLGLDLSTGYECFVKHDDTVDGHLDSLLQTIMSHEQETMQRIDANVVTWRGVLTKIMTVPYEDRDGFELSATLLRGAIFIEEHHEYKMTTRKAQESQPWRGPIPQEVMSFWGYKFETLSTIPAPWGETSREYIENRDTEVVSNKAQYCSVVRTGIGSTVLCLGGEVDAVWDSKPPTRGAPIKWVELKTSAEITSDRDADAFRRKLLKFWAQSFLLGVPTIIVGFRSRDGRLLRVEEIDVAGIPDRVASAAAAQGRRPMWDGNTCINFTSSFLDLSRKNVLTRYLPLSYLISKGVRATINDDGVWRIRRRPNSQVIEIFQAEETGHGRILTDEFINWRIKLQLYEESRQEGTS